MAQVGYSIELFSPKPGGGFGDYLGTLSIAAPDQWEWRFGLFHDESGTFDWVTYDGKLLSLWFDNMKIKKGYLFNYTRWEKVGGDKLEPPLHPWFRSGDNISGVCVPMDGAEELHFNGKYKD